MYSPVLKSIVKICNVIQHETTHPHCSSVWLTAVSGWISRITGGTPCSQTSLLKPLGAITLLHASILHWLVEQFGLITDYKSTDIIVTDVKRHISEPPAAMIQVNCGGERMSIISNVKSFAFYAPLVSKAATRQPTSIIVVKCRYIVGYFELRQLQGVQYYSIDDANKSWQHLNKERFLFFPFQKNTKKLVPSHRWWSESLECTTCMYFLLRCLLWHCFALSFCVMTGI